MSIRFQRRIKILPGLWLNLSKTGISLTMGTRGATVTARDGELTGNMGIPGTGISFRKRLELPESETVSQQAQTKPKRSGTS